MRITDQYFWNFVFVLFFVVLVLVATVILEGEAYKRFEELTLLDVALIVFASFRLVRLFVYDRITAFFREQFWDAKVMKTKVVLSKPATGPRRTLADLLSCPWCFGVWASAFITFCYLLTPYAYYAIFFLAVAGLATLIQLTANMIGWKAEELKHKVDTHL